MRDCKSALLSRLLALTLLHGFFIGAVAAGPLAQAHPDLAKVDISAYPWSSIAKLNNSIGGSCTAAVIDQDKVLTAAHCTFNRRTGRFLTSKSLHVLLGYEGGHYAVHALVGSYTLGPGYDPASELATASSDWAILKLVAPLPNQVRPLKLIDRLPAPGSQLLIGSYSQKRLHVMTADRNCQLVQTLAPSALLVHNCEVARGSSGAPLLFMGREGIVIIGIQVAVGQSNGAEIMLAVSAPSIGNMLAQQ